MITTYNEKKQTTDKCNYTMNLKLNAKWKKTFYDSTYMKY